MRAEMERLPGRDDFQDPSMYVFQFVIFYYYYNNRSRFKRDVFCHINAPFV